MASLDPKTRELEALYARQASTWVEIMRRSTPDDEMRFVAWLKESPRNVRDFLLMLSLDRALEEIDAERLEDIEALLAQVDGCVTRLPVRPFVPVVPAPPRRWWARAAIAASLILGVAGTVFWSMQEGYREYQTATGEQRTFELEDGSIVSLNTHSRIAIRLGAHRREVRLLDGEALFHVHHDASRPFFVLTDDAAVQAVGTQFDVYRRDADTVVSVLEGRVDVTPAVPQPTAATGSAKPPQAAHAGRKSESLGANQEARVSRQGSVSIREVSNVTDTVAWRERRLIFRDQTLGQIVAEFNRYRTYPIQLGADGVSERVYSGVFDADDAESLLQVLSRDPALLVDRSGVGIVVKARP
jgi:transmembrane sensor